MAEELCAFGEANSTLVLHLGCIQICLPIMGRFFPPNFLLWLFLCLLKIMNRDNLFSFLLTHRMEELPQRKSFIFHVLKLLSKSFSPNREISTPPFSFKISGNPALLAS